MESTYGDHDHRSLTETAAEAREVIKKAIEAGGKILVPVFAVGRTQILLYLLAGAFQRGMLTPFPIYIDSPMAIGTPSCSVSPDGKWLIYSTEDDAGSDLVLLEFR